MAQITALISAAGGVGKSILTANIGAALARLGFRVLLVDADTGLRSLDLVTGLSEKVFFHAGDVLRGRCEKMDAICASEQVPGLFLLPASLKRPEEETVDIRELGRLYAQDFDYILADVPSGISRRTLDICRGADRLLMLTAADRLSVRGADRMRSVLQEEGLPEPGLLITRYRKTSVKKYALMSVRDVRDILPLPLLGIVPEKKSIHAAADHGKLFAGGPTEPGLVVMNIARRLLGEEVAYAV